MIKPLFTALFSTPKVLALANLKEFSSCFIPFVVLTVFSCLDVNLLDDIL